MRNSLAIPVIALTVWFVLGSICIIFFQFIDGHYVRKPITLHIDPQNLQTDYAEYRPGDTVRLLFSYCRTRSFAAQTQWTLSNEVVVTFPPITRVLNPECVKDKWLEIATLPDGTRLGVHHLEGVTQITINNLNKVYIDYRSEDFEVI